MISKNKKLMIGILVLFLLFLVIIPIINATSNPITCAGAYYATYWDGTTGHQYVIFGSGPWTAYKTANADLRGCNAGPGKGELYMWDKTSCTWADQHVISQCTYSDVLVSSGAPDSSWCGCPQPPPPPPNTCTSTTTCPDDKNYCNGVPSCSSGTCVQSSSTDNDGKSCTPGSSGNENTAGGDGSYTCQSGYCDPKPKGTTYCGDGTTQSTEQCDDGNKVSGDGCSSTCQTEIACAPVNKCDVLEKKYFSDRNIDPDSQEASDQIGDFKLAYPECKDVPSLYDGIKCTKDYCVEDLSGAKRYIIYHKNTGPHCIIPVCGSINCHDDGNYCNGEEGCVTSQSSGSTSQCGKTKEAPPENSYCTLTPEVSPPSKDKNIKASPGKTDYICQTEGLNKYCVTNDKCKGHEGECNINDGKGGKLNCCGYDKSGTQQICVFDPTNNYGYGKCIPNDKCKGHENLKDGDTCNKDWGANGCCLYNKEGAQQTCGPPYDNYGNGKCESPPQSKYPKIVPYNVYILDNTYCKPKTTTEACQDKENLDREYSFTIISEYFVVKIPLETVRHIANHLYVHVNKNNEIYEIKFFRDGQWYNLNSLEKKNIDDGLKAEISKKYGSLADFELNYMLNEKETSWKRPTLYNLMSGSLDRVYTDRKFNSDNSAETNKAYNTNYVGGNLELNVDSLIGTFVLPGSLLGTGDSDPSHIEVKYLKSSTVQKKIEFVGYLDNDETRNWRKDVKIAEKDVKDKISKADEGKKDELTLHLISFYLCIDDPINYASSAEAADEADRLVEKLNKKSDASLALKSKASKLLAVSILSKRGSLSDTSSINLAIFNSFQAVKLDSNDDTKTTLKKNILSLLNLRRKQYISAQQQGIDTVYDIIGVQAGLTHTLSIYADFFFTGRFTELKNQLELQDSQVNRALTGIDTIEKVFLDNNLESFKGNTYISSIHLKNFYVFDSHLNAFSAIYKSTYIDDKNNKLIDYYKSFYDVYDQEAYLWKYVKAIKDYGDIKDTDMKKMNEFFSYIRSEESKKDASLTEKDLDKLQLTEKDLDNIEGKYRIQFFSTLLDTVMAENIIEKDGAIELIVNNGNFNSAAKDTNGNLIYPEKYSGVFNRLPKLDTQIEKTWGDSVLHASDYGILIFAFGGAITNPKAFAHVASGLSEFGAIGKVGGKVVKLIEIGLNPFQATTAGVTGVIPRLKEISGFLRMGGAAADFFVAPQVINRVAPQSVAVVGDLFGMTGGEFSPAKFKGKVRAFEKSGVGVVYAVGEAALIKNIENNGYRALLVKDLSDSNAISNQLTSTFGGKKWNDVTDQIIQGREKAVAASKTGENPASKQSEILKNAQEEVSQASSANSADSFCHSTAIEEVGVREPDFEQLCSIPGESLDLSKHPVYTSNDNYKLGDIALLEHTFEPRAFDKIRDLKDSRGLGLDPQGISSAQFSQLKPDEQKIVLEALDEARKDIRNLFSGEKVDASKFRIIKDGKGGLTTIGEFNGRVGYDIINNPKESIFKDLDKSTNQYLKTVKEKTGNLIEDDVENLWAVAKGEGFYFEINTIDMKITAKDGQTYFIFGVNAEDFNHPILAGGSKAPGVGTFQILDKKEAVVLSTGTGLDASGNQILTGEPAWLVATSQTGHFVPLPMIIESEGRYIVESAESYIGRMKKLFPNEALPIVNPGEDPLTVYKEWAVSNFNKYDLNIFEEFIRTYYENDIVRKKAIIIDRGVGGNKKIKVDAVYVELKPTKENPSGLIPRECVKVKVIPPVEESCKLDSVCIGPDCILGDNNIRIKLQKEGELVPVEGNMDYVFTLSEAGPIQLIGPTGKGVPVTILKRTVTDLEMVELKTLYEGKTIRTRLTPDHIVRLEDGTERAVANLKAGDLVKTGKGVSKVECAPQKAVLKGESNVYTIVPGDKNKLFYLINEFGPVLKSPGRWGEGIVVVPKVYYKPDVVNVLDGSRNSVDAGLLPYNVPGFERGSIERIHPNPPLILGNREVPLFSGKRISTGREEIFSLDWSEHHATDRTFEIATDGQKIISKFPDHVDFQEFTNGGWEHTPGPPIDWGELMGKEINP